MAYSDQATLHASATLRARVEVACARTAQYILLEGIEADNHPARLRWAHQVLGGHGVQASKMFWLVCVDPTTRDLAEAAITDVLIQAVVDTMAANAEAL